MGNLSFENIAPFAISLEESDPETELENDDNNWSGLYNEIMDAEFE